MGTEVTTYRISAVFYRMNPDGSVALAESPSPDERSAVPLIRFSPRQVTLSPGSNTDQTVRVRYAGPTDLEEGDYRAHIHFEPLPQETATKPDEAKKDKITMKLQVRLAVAVPVLYRQGNPTTKVALSGLKVAQSKEPAEAAKELAFDADMEAVGKAFAFGNIFAFFVPADPKATPIPVGAVRSLASYIPKRHLHYPLSPPEGLALKKGKLRLEFREPEENGGELLAQTESDL